MYQYQEHTKNLSNIIELESIRGDRTFGIMKSLKAFNIK